jgi:phage tail-like protein
MADLEPLVAYNYRVEIDGVAIAFSAVSGLDIEHEPVSYAESPVASGSPGPRIFNMPGPRKAPQKIELKRGVLTGANLQTIYAWINSIQAARVDKRDIYVRLCDGSGEAVISWKAINAFPIKLTSPEFKAEEEKVVAVETITLMADRIVIEVA